MSINLALPIISRNLAQLEYNYSCANTMMNYVIQELETISSELLIFNGIPLNIFSDELILTVYNLNERITQRFSARASYIVIGFFNFGKLPVHYYIFCVFCIVEIDSIV